MAVHGCKLALLLIDDQSSCPEAVENLHHILLMLLHGLAGQNDVTYVDEDERTSDQHLVHHPAFLIPKGRGRNSKRPNGVMMAVLGISSGCIKI
jgi:hypothetical protein